MDHTWTAENAGTLWYPNTPKYWSKRLFKIDKVHSVCHKFVEAANINSGYFTIFTEDMTAEMFQSVLQKLDLHTTSTTRILKKLSALLHVCLLDNVFGSVVLLRSTLAQKDLAVGQKLVANQRLLDSREIQRSTARTQEYNGDSAYSSQSDVSETRECSLANSSVLQFPAICPLWSHTVGTRKWF